MNKKVVLCLDWSNLLFRSLFINQLYGHITSQYDDMEDCRSFIYKFAADVCSIINIYRPNNVVLLTDSKDAWRKDVYDGYKKDRVKADNVNWDNIFECSDDLKKIFSDHGCNVAEVKRSEADDMAALCKEIVFEKYPDSNLIIVSADADLRQLLDFNPQTKQYCIIYNTTTKAKTGKRYLYVTQEFKDWLEKEVNEVDMFFGGLDYDKTYIQNILTQNSKIEMCVENPNDIVLHKIFCGDDGDSVPSFYDWMKDGKVARITPSKEKKIRDSLEINNVSRLLDVRNDIKPVMESVCKREIKDIDFNERLERQRTLVELNSALFPEHIREYKDTIDYIVRNFANEGYVGYIKVADLFKGTAYENADKKKAKVADVFHDMEKYGLDKMEKLF